MYEEGSIIYFTPFYFKQGGQDPKYFLVLKNIASKILLVTLPSSKAHIPDSYRGKHGCVDEPLSGICCYVFEKGRQVAQNGFSFPLETYLHGHWIDEYDVAAMEELYSLEHIDYEIIGNLIREEYYAVLTCFRNSKVVKNKYRRML